MTGSTDLMTGLKALDEAADDYTLAFRYYQGDIPEQFANEQIRRLVEGDKTTGGRYRFRFASIPVDAMANRVRIASVAGGREPVTTLIERIRDANDMEIQEPHIMREAFTYGDAYAMVWPVDQEEADRATDGEEVDVPPDDPLREAGVEISYQSPLSTRAIYDGSDGRRVRFVIRRWREKVALGKVWRAEIWYLDRMEPFITKPDSKGQDAEDWLPYAEDAQGIPVPAAAGNWPLPHDLGEIPIKHARTALPYGRPEHIDAYGPQDAITKAVMTQVIADIEAHGWPERWRIADDAQVLDTARDAVNWQDPADAGPARPTEVSGRTRGAAKEHIYTGTKEVGEYAPPDPGLLIAPIEQWVRMMATVTKTPYWEFDPQGGGQQSGVSRDKADAPMRARERDRKLYLKRFWREVYTLAVRQAKGGGDPGTVEINWAPPEVIADPDWWTTAKIRQEVGVPVTKILEEANYLPDDVKKWVDDQAEDSTLDQRITRLLALGEALQAVGAGAALLGIETNVMDMVSRILEEGGGEPLPPNWTPPEPEPIALPPGTDPNAAPPPAKKALPAGAAK